MATCYWLDDPGIESLLGKDFSHPSKPSLGSTQRPLKWVHNLFLGVKRPGRGADHQPPFITEVKERVELHPLGLRGLF